MEIDNACIEELQFLKTRYAETFDTEIPLIRASLQSVLQTILRKYQVPSEDFLSDDVKSTGTIGISDPQVKIAYLLTSPVVTLRELTNALGNVLYSSEHFSNAMFNYIVNTNIRNNFVQTRKRNMHYMLNLNESNNWSNLTTRNKTLWKKQFVLNKIYAYKRLAMGNIPYNASKNGNASCKLIIDNLIEPLSNMERQFYADKSMDPKNLPVVIGACKYAKNLSKNRRSRKRKQHSVCAVAGLSGYTLMLVDLYRLLGLPKLDIEYLLKALEYSFVPIHHSVSEIRNVSNIYNIQ